MMCGGAKTEVCGTANGLTIVYNSALATLKNGAFTLINGANNTPIAAGNGITLPAGFAAASPSIVAEGSSGRALTGAQYSADDMTNAACATYCSAAGFAISGTEYTSQW